MTYTMKAEGKGVATLERNDVTYDAAISFIVEAYSKLNPDRPYPTEYARNRMKQVDAGRPAVLRNPGNGRTITITKTEA